MIVSLSTSSGRILQRVSIASAQTTHEPCTNNQIKEILYWYLKTNQVLKRGKYFQLNYGSNPTTIIIVSEIYEEAKAYTKYSTHPSNDNMRGAACSGSL